MLNKYTFFIGLALMLPYLQCSPEQEQYTSQSIIMDKITIDIKELKVDQILKNENLNVNNSGKNTASRRKDLEEYVHYILDLHIPSSHKIKDPRYLNFAMEKDIHLECGGQSSLPALYINEGDLPGRNGINRIVVAFNKLDCNDDDKHLIKIDSEVLGLFEIEI